MHGPSMYILVFFLETSCNIQKKTKKTTHQHRQKRGGPIFFFEHSPVGGILQLLQAPVRLVFFIRLCHVQSLNNNIQECVRQLTHSAAWRTSKVPSNCLYTPCFLVIFSVNPPRDIGITLIQWQGLTQVIFIV